MSWCFSNQTSKIREMLAAATAASKECRDQTDAIHTAWEHYTWCISLLCVFLCCRWNSRLLLAWAVRTEHQSPLVWLSLLWRICSSFSFSFELFLFGWYWNLRGDGTCLSPPLPPFFSSPLRALNQRIWKLRRERIKVSFPCGFRLGPRVNV